MKPKPKLTIRNVLASYLAVHDQLAHAKKAEAAVALQLGDYVFKHYPAGEHDNERCICAGDMVLTIIRHLSEEGEIGYDVFTAPCINLAEGE